MTKLFKVGQAVTLKKNTKWVGLTEGPNDNPKPLFGKVYHCSGYDPVEECGYVFIYLAEFSHKDSFDQNNFAPLVDDLTLELELKEVFELTGA